MQHRVLFDFEIAFANGGGLRGWDFRLDIPGRAIDEAALARQVVDDMRLLMVDTVRISNARVIAEAHKRSPASAGSAP
ncbi:cyclase [Pseudoxanthomonas sp. 10H]|uniref:cyclase n=1 Tax=Pseudoxanthomonas sp. 10H TaxID=3242729 RepID=UPI003556F5AD